MAEIPINYLKYIDQDGTEKKVYPITVTDAVYDSDGNKLSNVLLGVLKDTDISNVQSDSTTTVPSSALLKATDDKIGDTSSLPGESSNVVSAITQLNSDMNLVFQARSDLSVDASNLTWMQSGIYRVRVDNPVNGIADGFLVHFTPYKNNDAWFQILIDFSGLQIYLRCKWYTTIRDWVRIKVIS